MPRDHFTARGHTFAESLSSDTESKRKQPG